MPEKNYALIGGAGKNSDLSLSLIDRLIESNYQIGIITKKEYAKDFPTLENLDVFSGDLMDNDFVTYTLQSIIATHHKISAYIHMAGGLVKSHFLQTDIDIFQDALNRNFLSAVPITQLLIQNAIAKNHEQHIIFLGATSSIRGSANFSPFSSAKFALRGFSQSLAREFGPKGIHICHLIIDGIIKGKRAEDIFHKSSSECIDGDDLAKTILHLIQQPRSTWTQEIDIRPFGEKF